MGVKLEERNCPHCGKPMEPYAPPPETGWNVILVCNNNDCPYYAGSPESIENKRCDSNIGCRYAVNPDNGYKEFALVSWCPK